METKRKRNQVSISVSAECAEMLRLVKSSYQIARKKPASYDELIMKFLPEGLRAADTKTCRIFEIASEEQDEETPQETDTQTEE